MATARRHPVADRELKKMRLKGHESMVLVGADRDVFLAAVTEPPEPTEKLVAALKRHREMIG